MNLRLKLIYFTVFCTGLFSLVYQTIWQRYLTFLVGADSRSSVITLTVFLSALSLGYYLAGRISSKISKNEIFYYGLMELFIGFWALLFPWLFHQSFLLVSSGWFENISGDVLLSVLLTALPAILMGTTLPFLTQGLSRNFLSSSKTHASIYGINTIGACFGALLTGFILIELFGLSQSMYLMGSLNVVLGIIMMAYKSTEINTKNKRENIDHNNGNDQSKQVLVSINKSGVLLVAACSGYLLIALESYFIRLFAIATDGSNYAYPTVVTAFIAAIGIGAALASKLMSSAQLVFKWVPLIVTGLWLLIYFTLPSWPYADYLLKFKLINNLGDYVYLPMIRFFVFLILIVLPIALSSMLLPMGFHFFKKTNVSLGKTTGNLYAVATLATIVGGLLGGFLLFDYLNFQQLFQSHFIIMIVMIFAALWAVKSQIKSYLQALLFTGLVFISLMWFPMPDMNKSLALTYYFQTPTENQKPVNTAKAARDWLWQWFDYDEIIATSNQAEGLVNVFNKQESNQNASRMIAINGRSNSGTRGTDYQGNALLSLFPYIMTESPKRVLVIGLGTGVTAGAVAAQRLVEKVDVCEINNAVIKQLPLFDFAAFNASQNPKISLIQSDVVKFLLRNHQKYDVIVSIPSNFWTAGIENLMTKDFYTLVKSRLSDGGSFIQWIPDYDFSEKGLLTLMHSFDSAFEAPSLWRLTQDDLVLMYQKNASSRKPWLNTRLIDSTLLDTMDAIDYPNPNQLKLAKILDSVQIHTLASYGEEHSLNFPSLGNIALQALYHPESGYSVEKSISQLLSNPQ